MSKWLLTRYMLTGLYVGFATVGVSVHWFLDHGVTWSQLVNWSTCMVSELLYLLTALKCISITSNNLFVLPERAIHSLTSCSDLPSSVKKDHWNRYIYLQPPSQPLFSLLGQMKCIYIYIYIAIYQESHVRNRNYEYVLDAWRAYAWPDAWHFDMIH